ncbi:MAG: Lrp/AsnC family transcriptional regulator [Inhella sp.]|jgi:Lrp/AsnC family leucine-responsive transcriptional regulator|uniref:Lrp/AsnC family transcriptional regulator n=1 Tax=Inhella sp. TaxID=1921806 RepID=UPI0022BF9C4B|nr:Lrp/AsnC family transcriptional regulator [Inhella sp.]MCZ8235865.1 Lrp/AsnC family transcriptional regulator [Inhella sp.]
MEHSKLDAIDCKILEVLQRDGRISNVDLAADVHLSAPQCFRRVRALEERGIVRGYRALVSGPSLGLAVTAFVSVNIEGGAFERVRDIERQLRDFPEVLEIHTVSGDSDYLLKVVATDLRHLGQLLTDRLMQIKGIADVRSMVCLEEVKAPSPLPVTQA